MCRATSDPTCPGGRRCQGTTHWYVNREAHERFSPDIVMERRWFKPTPLLSMTPSAIRMRRFRTEKYAAEVDACRTIHGLPAGQAIGPVLREELWVARYQGAGISLLAMASHFKAVAEHEGATVEDVAERFQATQIRPHRQSAGERLAALVVSDRSDWTEPDHLVRMVEPPENGTPSQAYVRVVRDVGGAEWVLVTSYDGSEPMAYRNDQAGLMAGMSEALERIQAINNNPDALDAYKAWLRAEGVNEDSSAPWRQEMSTADFLAHSGDGGMHLV